MKSQREDRRVSAFGQYEPWNVPVSGKLVEPFATAATGGSRLGDSRKKCPLHLEPLYAADVADWLHLEGRSRQVLARRAMRASGLVRVRPGSKVVFVLRGEWEAYWASDATRESQPVTPRRDRRSRGPRATPVPPLPRRVDEFLGL
jgi:hypothetical protein